MKTYINALKNRFSLACTRCYSGLQDTRRKLSESSGQFVMDHAIVFVIALVLGGIVVGLLTTYVRTDLANTIMTKLNDFFN